jgi:hypothetical protein
MKDLLKEAVAEVNQEQDWKEQLVKLELVAKECRKVKGEEVAWVVGELAGLVRSLRSGFVGDLMKFFWGLISDLLERKEESELAVGNLVLNESFRGNLCSANKVISMHT